MRSGDAMIKLMTFLVFFALLIYIGFGAVGSFFDPLKTELAESLTISDTVDLEGYVLRTETVLTGDDSYVLIEDNGAKVSVGQAICVKYGGNSALERAAEIKMISARIDQLQNTLSGRKSDIELRENTIMELSYAVQAGTMADITIALSGIDAYIYDTSPESEDPAAALEQLRERLRVLNEEAATDTSFYRAQVSGILSSVVDGYENVTFSQIEDITPSQLEKKFSGAKAADDALCKIVTGLDWYFAAAVDAADAEKLAAKDYHKITFRNNFGETVDMKLVSVGVDNGGKSVVIFSSNKFVSAISSLRNLSGMVTLSSYSGLKIPKDAVHTDPDGSTYVYVLAGLQAIREDISIKEDFGEYYAAETVEAGSTLRHGAEVITKARDLYDGKVVR